jgi:uncharacterized membrane protein
VAEEEFMPRFCGSCGAQLQDAATFCQSCGKPASAGAASSPVGAAASQGPAPSGGLTDNVAGMLAYFTIVPAIVFLVIEPYNKNRFVRFHAFQSIALNVVWIALWMLRVAMIPFLGFFTIFWLFIWPLLALAGFVIWLVLVLKAYQGTMFKLPVLGQFAEKQANSVPSVGNSARAA